MIQQNEISFIMQLLRMGTISRLMPSKYGIMYALGNNPLPSFSYKQLQYNNREAEHGIHTTISFGRQYLNLKRFNMFSASMRSLHQRAGMFSTILSQHFSNTLDQLWNRLFFFFRFLMHRCLHHLGASIKAFPTFVMAGYLTLRLSSSS